MLIESLELISAENWNVADVELRAERCIPALPSLDPLFNIATNAGVLAKFSPKAAASLNVTTIDSPSAERPFAVVQSMLQTFTSLRLAAA